MNKIYGIDSNKKITPLMVRDAIIDCFYQAHCAETGIDNKGKNNANREYCRSIIKKSFEDIQGDFNKPDKQSILLVMDKLVEFSKNFRDPSIIDKHYNEIIQLVDKLQD